MHAKKGGKEEQEKNTSQKKKDTVVLKGIKKKTAPGCLLENKKNDHVPSIHDRLRGMPLPRSGPVGVGRLPRNAMALRTTHSPGEGPCQTT